MASMPPVPEWLPVWHVVLAVGLLVSAGILLKLTRPRGRWGLLLRRRLVVGVPWGTLLSVTLVLCVYLFLQDGWNHWHAPVTIPFRAWSYFYPLGILAAGFAHSGVGHLTGNLLATLVFGSLAEYAWGHFPTERGASTFSSLRTNPYARILAFPAAAVVAGVLGGAFGLGPVIGFSGVVFAFVGFALVRYPIATVVALLGSDVVNLVYRAVQSPVVHAGASPSFGRPWWADIAIQGHALGLFLGIVAGAVLFGRWRGVDLSPARLWFAALVLAADRGLWAVYTFEGNQQFVLFRALGVALVFVLAALVASGLTASTRDLIAVIDLSRREAAFGLLLATLLALGIVAVPYNLFVVDDPTAGTGGTRPVEVRDYTVFYAEDVPNQLVSTVEIEALNQTTRVNDSGVFVVSERRNIWWTVVGKRELAFGGQRRVRVGGVGWRATVRANRTGWSAVGGPTAYKIRLKPPDGDWRLAFASDPAQAAPTVAGRNVSVAPADAPDANFTVAVSRNNTTLGRAPVPVGNQSVAVGGLRLVRDDDRLVAIRNDTRVPVASRETYRG